MKDKTLALTPPMGWNSFDGYGCSVREEEVLENARFMQARLLPYGWDTVVVDGDWADPDLLAGGCRPNAVLEMDEYGRLVPAVRRFPSAAGGLGFKALADAIHALGLKFGLHIQRGIPRQAVQANTPIWGSPARAAQVADPTSICPWNTDMYGVDMSQPGGQAYYDSLAALYTGWGVDFIKADDIASPFYPAEIAALSAAIAKTGRPIVLSLSPGDLAGETVSDPERVAFLHRHAHLWRISSDFWDRWADLQAQFERLALWAPLAAPGGWPDADMLPIGHLGPRPPTGPERFTCFTPAEQLTLLSLWLIARSPLMLGGDLTRLDSQTLDLLTNREALAVNQTARASRELFRTPIAAGWLAESPQPGIAYLALFNLAEQPAQVGAPLDWVSPATHWQVYDLWAGRPFPDCQAYFSTLLPPHGAGLYRLEAC